MFSTTSSSTLTRLGLSLIAVWVLSACSKPGPTVVIDGNEWMRCALGQTWEENTCTGKAQTFTFDEALATAKRLNAEGGVYGKTDWRVPTVRQLASLLVCSTGFEKTTTEIEDGAPAVASGCNGGSDRPTIDVKKFPNAHAVFWSSSPYVRDSRAAWAVSFGYGGIDYSGLSFDYQVRLVRASQ